MLPGCLGSLLSLLLHHQTTLARLSHSEKTRGYLERHHVWSHRPRRETPRDVKRSHARHRSFGLRRRDANTKAKPTKTYQKTTTSGSPFAAVCEVYECASCGRRPGSHRTEFLSPPDPGRTAQACSNLPAPGSEQKLRQRFAARRVPIADQ